MAFGATSVKLKFTTLAQVPKALRTAWNSPAPAMSLVPTSKAKVMLQRFHEHVVTKSMPLFMSGRPHRVVVIDLARGRVELPALFQPVLALKALEHRRGRVIEDAGLGDFHLGHVAEAIQKLLDELETLGLLAACGRGNRGDLGKRNDGVSLGHCDVPPCWWGESATHVPSMPSTIERAAVSAKSHVDPRLGVGRGRVEKGGESGIAHTSDAVNDV